MSFLTGILFAAALTAPADGARGRFEYDPADETVRAAMIGGENCYDAHVATRADAKEIWLTWLEFEPGKGDRIWVGQRAAASSRSPEEAKQDVQPPKENGWTARKCVTPEPGIYKNPTLTLDKSGGFWLSYERQQGDKWSVAAWRLPDDMNTQGDAVKVGPGINHRTASAPDGGTWIVWQAPKDGQFDVMAARLSDKGVTDGNVVGTVKNANDWQPDVAVLPDGQVQVIWDARDKDSETGFDVYTCSRKDGMWGSPELVSAKNGFEARAKLAADSAGSVWALWEEGSENWGGRYISRMRKLNQEYLEITDVNGPLHAFRRLNFAKLDASGQSSVALDLPMPAFGLLAQRPKAPKDVRRLGGYYEAGELTVDGLGRVWVVYRHYYLPWVGIDKTTHKQEDWGVYARCFDGKGWSKLFRCDIGQGDGMQRLSIAPRPEGIAMAYSTGRTDRRPGQSALGTAFAVITLPAGEFEVSLPARTESRTRRMAWKTAQSTRDEQKPEYQLFFGDLHRHTDLSLCYVPTDGTMDDAYRFAIDVAGLDFMGITDHSRDIAEGSAKSLLWWRCRKEVSRHDLSPKFIPMYAYEHSRGGEDHNVIALHPNLWPDTMPFPQLWKQMDNDSFSIPHQTLCKDIPPGGEMPLGLDEKTWTYRDDARRPLLEIYQGCRDRAIERDAHVALGKGHIMGFIASSDHLSINASFAGVWAKEKTREAIFRAMQARRTFGATDRIRLKVTMGEHWMGEKVPSSEVKPVSVEVEGTASIESIELIVDGQVKESLPPKSERVSAEFTLPALTGKGIHYFYIRVKQSDGNQAWSSPIWIEG